MENHGKSGEMMGREWRNIGKSCGEMMVTEWKNILERNNHAKIRMRIRINRDLYAPPIPPVTQHSYGTWPIEFGHLPLTT